MGGSSAETAAYDSMSGEVLWAVRTQGFAAAYAVGVSSDGNTLFATGESKGGYGTVAYDIATGGARWRSVMEAGAGYERLGPRPEPGRIGPLRDWQCRVASRPLLQG